MIEVWRMGYIDRRRGRTRRRRDKTRRTKERKFNPYFTYVTLLLAREAGRDTVVCLPLVVSIRGFFLLVSLGHFTTVHTCTNVPFLFPPLFFLLRCNFPFTIDLNTAQSPYSPLSLLLPFLLIIPLAIMPVLPPALRF